MFDKEYAKPGQPLVGFSWRETEFSHINTKTGETANIHFDPYALGQVARITVNNIPCGQLSLPVGFIEGKVTYNRDYYNLPIGSISTQNGKKHFEKVFFPQRSVVSGSYSYKIDTKDYISLNSLLDLNKPILLEELPLGTVAIIFYRTGEQAYEDLPVSIFTYNPNSSNNAIGSAIDFYEGINEKYQACLVQRISKSRGDWEEIEAKNGIYVHIANLDGSSLNTPSDGINEENIVLPDPNVISENLLLKVTYRDKTISHAASGNLNSYSNTITDPSSISTTLYYKGTVEKLNSSTGYFEKTTDWIPIPSLASIVDRVGELEIAVRELQEGGAGSISRAGTVVGIISGGYTPSIYGIAQEGD